MESDDHIAIWRLIFFKCLPEFKRVFAAKGLILQ
jgi:hypothetical protein